MLRIYLVAAVVWAASLVLSLTVFGGITSPVVWLSVVATALVIVFGIASELQFRRAGQTKR